MRILVVDDEPSVRDALDRALRLDGYRVRLAHDGRSALDALADEPPDAVVLDVLMPEPDGLEVCRRIRAAGDRTPVLLLTARDAVPDRVQGLDAGADDYLVKPFSAAQLEARVRAVLRRYGAGQNERPVLTVAGLSIDLRARVATLDGEHITFTPTPNFNGSATLTYTVSDGHATATGVVTISVGLVNDAPSAVDDVLGTDVNTPLAIDPYQLIGNDSDPDDGQPLALTAVGDAQHGTVSLSDGMVTFTPDDDFTGDATFLYTVSDGALTASALCTVTVTEPSLPE